MVNVAVHVIVVVALPERDAETVLVAVDVTVTESVKDRRVINNVRLAEIVLETPVASD